MRDFPVFTTQHGVASLVLREIPYKGAAYITIHDTLQPEKLLRDCVDFCKIAGATRFYATGHRFLEKFPVYTAVWQMSRLRCGLPRTDAKLRPVSEKTMELWRSLYNEKMADIPNGATMTRADAEKHLKQRDAWFVYREENLLGIGIAAGGTVESVIAARPGAGETVLLALCSVLSAETVTLEVASTNLSALRLYERLRFQKITELSRWYDVGK